ncbi:MAG: hypothetical protein UX81_C0026G0004 [Parcubacteria group bacterium GW2011_GWA2_47_12]|nr:MAG: hypothetical protein UX81_C0026G0004 [Parcubacteria group bacterium GW2011_GWA2_47_12]
MNEVYLGPESDQKYIATYLGGIRELDPIEIATLPKPIKLSDTLHMKRLIDIGRFWEITRQCIVECEQKYSVSITTVQPERYYTAQPTEADTIGGFHDPRSLGYQYWYHASFVLTLNERLVLKEIRTLELIRNFLHDCFHHSTFRSYRRAMRFPAASTGISKHRVPEVYREQYGINFRDKDGCSYSSAELTRHSPETINLNLLMDGVVIMVVSELMHNANKWLPAHTSGLERAIVNEIFLEPFDTALLPHAHSFYVAVTEPSRKFVAHWGGDTPIVLALQAMMSGELGAIKCFFEEKTGTTNVWEKMFKKPGFSIPENPDV